MEDSSPFFFFSLRVTIYPIKMYEDMYKKENTILTFCLCNLKKMFCEKVDSWCREMHDEKVSVEALICTPLGLKYNRIFFLHFFLSLMMIYLFFVSVVQMCAQILRTLFVRIYRMIFFFQPTP